MRNIWKDKNLLLKKTSDYTVETVKNESQVKEFLDFPSGIYRNSENWIRPLDNEIEKVFNPKKNDLFRHGKAVRWLLFDSDKNVIGRLAAFFNRKNAEKNEQPTGGIGFFECINDQNAANTLFDQAKVWLMQNGMEAMDGPINFGDRNDFWGCLSDGFHEPVFNMPYNFKYYNDLFTNYGFKNYFNQYTYRIKIKNGVKSQIIRDKAKHLMRDKGYRFEIFDWKKYDQYADDFVTVFNQAWGRFSGVSKMKKTHAKILLDSLKPIIDPKTLIFGYYYDEPVAFYIMVPDLNQIIKNFNGKLNAFNKLRLMFELKVLKKCDRLIGLIFGVVPKHQGKGVESAMVVYFEDEIIRDVIKFKYLEMNWIGDFNPQMMKLVDQIGGEIYKTHITYRYLFDRSKEFKRAAKLL